MAECRCCRWSFPVLELKSGRIKTLDCNPPDSRAGDAKRPVGECPYFEREPGADDYL